MVACREPNSQFPGTHAHEHMEEATHGELQISALFFYSFLGSSLLCFGVSH
jgi:hypothetical protein